jgi:phage FluMu protein Com
MPTKAMRRIEEGEVPFDGGTAVQDDADRPVFRGNGAFDYACVDCGNVLATGMDPEHMGRRVRIKCGRCRTVNVSADVPVELARRRR